MRQQHKLLYNTALLTASDIVLRIIALAFQVWLVGKIGSSGIGLFQLVLSTGMLATTLAVSGIRFASTRLIAEEIGSKKGGVSGAVRRCELYALCFGILAAVLLYAFAEPIGFLWIGDARTVTPLRLFALGLPFIALSSVYLGYFAAVGRVYKSALTSILESLVRIAAIVLLLQRCTSGNLEQSCRAIILGGTISEVFSFFLLGMLCILDRRAHGLGTTYGGNLTKRMLQIALPLAVSAYMRTSLTTLQSLLVPKGLRAAGFTAESAISGYGVVTGMVFPIIAFPSCLMAALAELLVPTLTEAQVSGRTGQVACIIETLLRRCLLFSLGVAGILFTFSDALGQAVYQSSEAGDYIQLFSLIVPIMYMDIVIDGCLKGLGEMLHNMVINIVEALIGVVLVYTLLPTYALNGYIAIVCFTEVLNFILSFQRLRRHVPLRIQLTHIIAPLLCAIGCGQAALLAFGLLGIDIGASVPIVLCVIGFAALAYFLLLWISGCFHLPNCGMKRHNKQTEK
ncbi:MAG: polysaccharide biosynthesis C-terminal domain-containing protein [Oscillospiraceae bacterium]|jgi:O-antigen/teichoic acid export membrane protein